MLKYVRHSRGMLVSTDVIYEEDVIKGNKAKKKEAKNKLKVTVDNIDFDADTESINYMSAVLSRANGTILEKLAKDSNLTMADAYNDVYSSTIKWKCADNIVREVTISTIAKALDEALGAIANIIGI